MKRKKGLALLIAMLIIRRKDCNRQRGADGCTDSARDHRGFS